MIDMELLVSVLTPTYNQAKYISQAIEGALKQKTNFPFEILIGEDDSRRPPSKGKYAGRTERRKVRSFPIRRVAAASYQAKDRSLRVKLATLS